jgi:aspartyl-tRNA(Asn)/glutamyl-tRNA(Gln) amidotransferase subunit B
MDYEVRWQIERIEDGHAIQQATVLFDPDTGETRAMRSKEDAADYRYFPDPDLPPLMIGRDWVEKTQAEMSELPRVMAARFVADYGLPEYDAGQLTQNKAMAAYFEAVALASKHPKLASNWVMGELSRRLNADELEFKDCPVNPLVTSHLICKVVDGTLNIISANQLLDRTWSGELKFKNGSFTLEMSATITGSGGLSANLTIDELIDSLGLRSISDAGELEKIIDDVLATNAKNVEEIRAGNAKAMNALVGQAMKATKGKANPAQVNELLKKKIG